MNSISRVEDSLEHDVNGPLPNSQQSEASISVIPDYLHPLVAYLNELHTGFFVDNPEMESGNPVLAELFEEELEAPSFVHRSNKYLCCNMKKRTRRCKKN